jgi:hypothetical protein
MTVTELIEALIPFADDAEVVIFVPIARLRWGTYSIVQITPYSPANKQVVINMKVEE